MSQPRPQSFKSRMTGLAEDYFSVTEEHPHVRLSEVIHLKNFASIRSPQRILDVPTEGVMMRSLFPESIVEQAEWMVPKDTQFRFTETNFKLENFKADSYDAVVGIAPLHHANDIEKSDYLTHSRRVLKSGGTLSFGEVEEGSKSHFFLDEFVHLNSVNGHQGAYLDQSFDAEMAAHGFGEVASAFRPCPWIFEGRAQLAYFLTRLFGLNPMQDEHLISQVKQYLSVEEKNNKISVEWGLRYFRGIKI